MGITGLFVNRRHLYRRLKQFSVAVLVGAIAFLIVSAAENGASPLGVAASYYIGIVLFFIAFVILLRWELKAINENYGLSFLPPGFGTLRSRKLEGEGRFLSLLELATTFRFKSGGILFGRPVQPHRLFGLFDGLHVGPEDDRHVITIAGSRAGKGTAALIPNLLLYPGSALVIDPKGELATITAARRGNGSETVRKGLGQKVHIFDPESIVSKGKTARWNPLAELDINRPDVLDDASRVAYAIIPETQAADSSAYFISQARNLLTALILHVLEVEPPEKQNLIFVRSLINRGDDELFDEIESEAKRSSADNPYVDAFDALMAFMADGSAYRSDSMKKAAGAAARITRMAEEERSGVINQLAESTNFLDRHSMERALQASDFKLSELKTEPTTIYICLKGTSMATDLKKILTIFVDLAIAQMERTQYKPTHPVLFAMDEFYALGYMKSLDDGIGLVAGYGVKLWPVLQHLSQLKRLYSGSWENFVANCGAMQLFGDVDTETIDYVSTKRIGEAVYRREDGTTERRPLLTPNELASSFFNRSSRRQLVLFHQQPAAILELMDYYKFFPKDAYEPDNRSK